MKKMLVLVLALSLVVFMLVGCGSNTTTPEENPTDTPAENVAVKLGLGTITSIAKSKDYSVDAEKKETLAVGQVDNVIAAAIFDAEGKIVSVTIDTAQTRVNFDNEMQLTSDKTAEIKTKIELGDEYGMLAASKNGKNWDEQIAELENWMIGKTVAEIKAMPLNDEAPDVPELTSLVTIGVQDYIAAVEKAYNNAVDVEGAVTLGLGHKVSIAKSKGYSKEGDKETLPTAQVDTVIAATAFDADGKVAGAVIDTAQTRVNFDAAGTVTSDKTAEIKTKVELGDEYGMLAASKIGKNWYEQIAELENWMVGKTVAEITSLQLNENVPDVPELTSLVTIKVHDYLAAVEEAYANAK